MPEIGTAGAHPTWNVNSVKQRLPRLLPWLDERQPDVVCLQETKLADGGARLDQAPDGEVGSVVPPPSAPVTRRGAANLPQSP